MRRELQAAFNTGTLDAVRIAEVPVFDNPSFYAELDLGGGVQLLNFQQMAGITFGDTIAISPGRMAHGETLASLLFHELVHVVQYDALGINEFIRRYVLGWAAAGFDYYQIPFERDAYELQATFDANGALADVEPEVVRRLRARPRL